MNFNSPKLWFKASALVLVSPAFATVAFLLVVAIVLVIPILDTPAQWTSDDRPIRAIGFALFSTVMSIDIMLRSFYLTLPILAGAAVGLLSFDMGIQSRLKRTLVQGFSLGVLYALLYIAGTRLGWLEPVFWT